MDALTDLEAVALGCISKKGRCTAYAIRREFKSSPSSRFSDSAGSVYPMVTRLARRKLLRSRRESQGERGATVYECTAAGLVALRNWMSVPEDPAQLMTWDPLRTRALYLGLLSKREGLRWLDEADRALGEHIAEMKSTMHDEPTDKWLLLARRNALLQAKARVRWLGEVREAVGG